jgi:hypothetical protein
MAELKRIENDLTTADLAGRTQTQTRSDLDPLEKRDTNRPKPVRSETVDARPRENTSPATPINRATEDNVSTPLFSESDIGDLQGRWSSVQTSFVDEPRRAVEEADKLVATVMQRLAEGFANERSSLEKQWDRGDNISTEDLRVAMQRYRSFFDRLLHA